MPEVVTPMDQSIQLDQSVQPVSDASPAASELSLPLNINDIKSVIPHRYPFIMVDRVTCLIPGERIEGIKNVSINEEYFQGHFPSHPIMPGVLQLEALGQLAGILVASMPQGQGKMGLFTGMNNIRFRRMVTPGDQLQLKATVQRIRLPMCKFLVEARVDGQITVEGELSFSMIEASALSSR